MRHAPAGGWVDGDWYAGGQFLPDDEPSRSHARGPAAGARAGLRPGTTVALGLSAAGVEQCRVLFVDRGMARCTCIDARGVERLTWIACVAIESALAEARGNG